MGTQLKFLDIHKVLSCVEGFSCWSFAGNESVEQKMYTTSPLLVLGLL